MKYFNGFAAVVAISTMIALAGCKDADASVTVAKTIADACATATNGDALYGSLDQFEGSDKIKFTRCIRQAVSGKATSVVGVPTVTIDINVGL